jgi:hypothetical protein
MMSTVSGPINSIVFVSDNLHTRPPVHTDSDLIHANGESVSVGCYPEIDGNTEFTLGKSKEVTPKFAPAFDGMIETPNRKLMITTVLDEILLETDVSDLNTRVRVWLNHPKWPDKVVVGWG